MQTDTENPAQQAPKHSRKPRRKKHYFLRFMLFVAAVAGLLLLASSDLFNIRELEVEGNKYYTAAQIAKMSGVQSGKNIFTAKLAPVRDTLLTDPYIKLVNVKRELPDTIRITVTERDEYAAVPYGTQFVIIDCDGLVLRISDTAPVLPVLQGMTINEMTPGEPLGVTQTYLLTDTLELLLVMEENDLYFKRVDFSTVVVKAYIYDDLYCEGTPAHIKDNMPSVKKLLEELYSEEVTRGVIKVGKDNYLSFTPKID